MEPPPTWWPYEMETVSALQDLCTGNSPVTSGFPPQRSVTRSFDVFLDQRLNKRLCKQSSRRWFEMPSRSLWRHYKDMGSRGFKFFPEAPQEHYIDAIMGAIASQITSLTIVYSTVYSDADQRKHQSSASLAFVRGIYRGPVSSPHKWSVTRKMFPFDDVIMKLIHFQPLINRVLLENDKCHKNGVLNKNGNRLQTLQNMWCNNLYFQECIWFEQNNINTHQFYYT